MKKFLCILFCAVLVMGFAGCAKKLDERTAPELAEEGEQHFEAGDYDKALEAYKRLSDWYPYSPHARKAQLRIADSHYHLGQYEEAIFEYEQYEQLYPADSKIPYVIYQIGLCYYERIRTVDRTQVPTKNALETFERLTSRFPASEYAEKADPKIRECRKNLARHEFYVGRFYFRSGHYKAAIKRFQNVINAYPEDFDVYQDASQHLEKAEKKLAEQDEPPDEPVDAPADAGVGTQIRPLGDDSISTPAPAPMTGP